MPATDILIAFLLATAVFAYMPGPSMLYTAARTLTGGQRAGWLAAFGIHIGGYVHVLAAAVGLAAIFQIIPILYAALKLIGAIYLIWLGIRMIVISGKLNITGAVTKHNRAFWQSVTVEVLNPKTAVFYLAFLPQFTDPSAALPIWSQLLILGAIVNIMFSSADVICVLLADRITSVLQKSQASTYVIQRIGGGVLVALGINLAFTRT